MTHGPVIAVAGAAYVVRRPWGEQAVDRAGSGWILTARAEDRTIETLEWSDRRWPALGVQWHPELDSSGPPFSAGWSSRPRGAGTSYESVAMATRSYDVRSGWGLSVPSGRMDG